MRAKAGRNVATVRSSTGMVLVYGCGESIHQYLNLKAKRNCAISLGREGLGNWFTISGVLSVEVVDGGWVAGEKVRYESPEALLASQEMNTVATSELRPPVDVWSFACIMLELATGQRPYAQVLLKRYVQKLGSPAVHILLQNPRAHALGFFQPALGFLPIVA